VADELKKVIRLAGRNPEGLEGELPALSGLYRVTSAGVLDEAARVHFILYRLIPEYLQRLPPGRDGRAIRELLTWEDEDGEWRPLTTRYHKAAGHLVNAASDFGRRQEPRLLLECARRFIALDHDDRLDAASTASPVTAGVAGSARASLPTPPADQSPAAGIVRVHKNLDYQLLVDCMTDADEIMILNTWIPGLDILADALIEAITQDTYVSILMLHPDSHIAQLRSQALQASTQARFREDRVQPEVRHCLEVLAAISRAVSGDCRRNLRVRLYHSLPSISVYNIDDRAFFSVFLHGHLAINSVQIEVQGQDSLMGRLVFRELETLWKMGYEVKEMEQWQSELESMRQSFGIAP
jgi:hypothetical protein